ncbi:hypothetical protein GOBAR_DD36625 [Gossypium barbadense]|nr:hypothetical protein GOBAR_DD36625 [Gossypium barbadense]
MEEQMGFCDPEISIVRLTPSHLFFVVASDGVFEFLSSQTVVNKAAAYKDPSDACAAIAGDSYKRWLELENRTNDITIIIVQIKGLSNSGVGTTDSELHSRPCQIGGSMNQSTAIVPPLMHQRPLESVGCRLAEKSKQKLFLAYKILMANDFSAPRTSC